MVNTFWSVHFTLSSVWFYVWPENFRSMRAGLFLIASDPVLLELDLQTSRPPPPRTVWHATTRNIPPLAARAPPFSFLVAPAAGPCPSPASQPAAPCLVHTTQADGALPRP
jgi:hypothetical protein